MQTVNEVPEGSRILRGKERKDFLAKQGKPEFNYNRKSKSKALKNAKGEGKVLPLIGVKKI